MKKPSEQGLDLAAVFLLGRLKPVQQTSCLIRPTILGQTFEPEEQSVERSHIIQRPLFKE